MWIVKKERHPLPAAKVLFTGLHRPLQSMHGVECRHTMMVHIRTKKVHMQRIGQITPPVNKKL